MNIHCCHFLAARFKVVTNYTTEGTVTGSFVSNFNIYLLNVMTYTTTSLGITRE